MSQFNILWVTDHCCYDGMLHAGGRLFEYVIPRMDAERFRVVPCMIRASEPVRKLFEEGPLDVDIFDRNRFDLRTIWTFYRIFKREKIDVAHLHCYGTSTYGRIASIFTGTPCIIHDYVTDFYFPYPRYLEFFDRLIAGRTAGAIASNPLVKEFTIKRRRIPPEKVRLMFHPVLPERYEPVPQEEVARVRQQLEIPEGAKVVGALTKLAPERGNELLLDAAKEVVEALPDTTFLFVYSPTELHRLPRGYSENTHTIGRHKNRTVLEEQARRLGIESNVRFFETVDVPNQVEAACDVLAAPWLSERFSVARLLDAMPKGKPIIATDQGEPRAIVRNGINGYLVEPAIRGLSEKLVALLSDPEQLKKLSEGARAVSREYHIDNFVKQLEDWYTELAQARRAVAR